MNRNSSVKARIAISLLPKLNSCIYLPLIERCGGLEGFFLESDQTLNQLYRELNIPTDTFNRKTAIQNSEAGVIRNCSGNVPMLPWSFFIKGS